MREQFRAAVWNEESRRLRLPVRLAAFVVVLAAFGLVVGLVGYGLGEGVERLLLETWPSPVAILAARELVVIAVPLVTIVTSVLVTARYLDRRRLADLGLRIETSWWIDLVFGLGLGAALVAGIFVVEYAAGWVVVTDTFQVAESPFAFWQAFGLVLALFLAVGVYEEVFIRGYLLTNVAEGLTWFDRIDRRRAVLLAALVTALVFGAGHAANPNASLASVAGISLAGLMLATGYVLTGELAIPIGIHVSWNLVQGAVFGFPVSGLALDVAVLQVRQNGPTLATGGTFGPEAGLLGVLASLVGVVLIAAWVTRRGPLGVDGSIATPALREPTERDR